MTAVVSFADFGPMTSWNDSLLQSGRQQATHLRHSASCSADGRFRRGNCRSHRLWPAMQFAVRVEKLPQCRFLDHEALA